LELEEGTLGGQFTTIEGLLTQVKEQVGEICDVILSLYHYW